MTPATPHATAPPADTSVQAALSDPQTLARLRLWARVLLRRGMSGLSEAMVVQLADDVASRTAEAALAGRFDPARGKPVWAWLYGIARKMVLKERDAQPPAIAAGSVDWASFLVDDSPSPEEGVVTDATRQEVREALTRLDDRDELLIRLHYFDGLATPEIARRLGAEPGTVRVWLHRARKAVEQALLQSGEGGT